MTVNLSNLFRSVNRIFLPLFCLLLFSIPAISSEPADSSSGPVKFISAVHNDGASDTGVIFEEPHVNGNHLGDSLLDPDNCLEPSDQKDLPMIAIIIDDMGHHHRIGDELLDLDLNLTFSFLPYAPFTQEQGKRAQQMGRDILVHMPMEPQDSAFDPGPGTLYLGDSTESIIAKVEKNIAQVPFAIGVNNHMGSKITPDRYAMHGVMSVLKKKNLFFVDSLTTGSSVAANEARNMEVRTGRRAVFLDNSHIQADICRQLKRLVTFAKKNGSGIGIGHPNRATIEALKKCRDLLLQQVRIVGVSELVQ